MLLSIIVPVYNEEGNLGEFYKRAKKVTSQIKGKSELIFINDGSRDRSLAILKKIARRDRSVKIISLSRNFGHQAAITCGFDAAEGEAVATIDADLQDPPEVILDLVKKWHAGAKIVFAKRISRRDGFFKRLSAKIFYRLIDKLSETDIPLDTGDFRLMDRSAVEAFKKMREHSRFVRGMVSWIGFSQDTVEFERDKRLSGKTHYPFRKMLRLALDGIFSFSHKPLKAATWLGVIATIFGVAYAGFAIWERLAHPEKVAQGWTSLIVIVLIISGVQLVILGIIGEYLGRVYTEEQNRPLYVIEEKINLK
jgi:dolichol-phosphate mannosyltransferase